MLWLFVTVWATDTGAFVAGRGLGGPRLAPRLSPNKTWTGFGGGLLSAAIVGWVAARLAGAAPAGVVAASIGLSVAAQIGDLAEFVGQAAVRRQGFRQPHSGSWRPARPA